MTARRKRSAEDDLSMVRCAAAGERPAFDALFERYADRVFRFAAARARDAAEAERASEAALCRVFAELGRYTGAVELDAWVLARVCSACAEHLDGLPAQGEPRSAASS